MNIDGVDYIRRDPTPEHHAWAWIIIIVVIILVIIVIYYYRFWTGVDTSNNDFGTYSDPVTGVCTGTNLCTDPGQQAIVRKCIPNPDSNKGCIIPGGPDEGKQSYDSIVEVRECSPQCVISNWQQILPDAPCVVKDVPISLCVPSGTRGTRKIEYRCVSNDLTGTNKCTAYEVQVIDGVSSYILNTYQLGEISSIENPCSDFANPICGDWSVVVPLPPAQPVPIENQAIGPCALNVQFKTDLDCVINYKQVDDNPIYNFLREGHLVNPLSCVYTEDGDMFANTPVRRSLRCPKLESPNCVLPQSITSDQIIGGDLPVNKSGEVETTLCGTITDRNPSCYQTCRLLGNSDEVTNQFIQVTDSSIGPILDKWLSIRLPGVGYLSLKHIPCDLPDRKTLAMCDAVPSDELFNVPTMIITDDLSNPGCTSSETEFDTSLILSIGLRSYDSGTVSGQLLSIASSNFTGWLSSVGSTIIWKQALNQYQGFGISSVDEEASEFTISVTRPLDPNPPAGFPDGTLGTIGLSIKDENGQSISIPVINSSDILTLDDIEAIIYDPNVLNLIPRDDPLGCNLLLG
jgi:hypothetical protein